MSSGVDLTEAATLGGRVILTSAWLTPLGTFFLLFIDLVISYLFIYTACKNVTLIIVPHYSRLRFFFKPTFFKLVFYYIQHNVYFYINHKNDGHVIK